MPFIPMLDTWRVAFSFDSTGGNNAANVIHIFDQEGNMTGTRAAQVALEVRNWADAEWAPIANINWNLRSIAVADAGSQTGASAENLDDTPGEVAQAVMPSQDTIALRLGTGAMGRSQRGRLYVVGMSEADIVDGLVSQTYRDAVVAAYIALQDALEVVDLHWGVASFFTNGAPRVTGVIREITSWGFADAKVDRQIRRKK